MAFLDYLSKLLPGSKKSIPAQYYFGLNIKHGLVIGSVWGIEGSKVRIISVAQRKFASSEEVSENPHSLIESANISLDEALADFMPEPEQILFGIPDLWLQDEQLKPKYSKVLKQLVKELDVSPLAYVSQTHAICHFLQRKEGVPTTAILVEISDPLSVSVIKVGKVLGTKEQPRSDNLPRDIEKALFSFPDIEVMPAKILIFGKGEMQMYKEELVSFNWMGQLPFLHLPKIEELEENIEVKSLSFAGASEMNPHVHLDHQSVPMENRASVGDAGHRAGHIKPHLQESVLPESAFVEGDIEQAGQQAHPEATAFTDSEVDLYQPPRHPDPHKGAGSIISKRNFNPLKIFGNLGLGLLIPIIVLIALTAAYVLLPKATVIIFADPKILEKETQIIADPKITSMDESNKLIPGKIIETTVDGTSRAGATGKKQVGDPAKGIVILYNKTASPKTFSQGTQLTGPDNVNFILDSAVNVASQSAVEGGISFGKSSAKATASTIGPDGNLPAGKDLTIKGQSSSDYSAKVDTAFSGGISKDVTVVTSDDQKKLLASLTAELKKKAQEQVQGKLTGDMKILEETFSEKVLKQAFSKNAGDQASEFSLTLNLNLKGTAYSDSDLKSIVGKLVETNVPEGYDLDLSRTETQATVSKVEKDGKIVFTAKFKAKLMPRLDLNKIKKDIIFKTPLEVENLMKSYESVIGADIKISPQLPNPLQRLPILPQNIKIEVSSN